MDKRKAKKVFQILYFQVPKDKNELAVLQERLRKRFPVEAFNKARKELDPNRILSNGMVEKMFPLDD